jgi:cellulose synthase/poly-beta-1,6-N-acetylglucosamine synthase-like glycosyltransferase
MDISIESQDNKSTTSSSNDSNSEGFKKIKSHSEDDNDIILDVKEDVKEDDKEDVLFIHDSDVVITGTKNHTTCVEFRGQQHFRPKKTTKYWYEDRVINKTITILVPFYNEEVEEILLTLNSVYQDFEKLNKMGYNIHILLVMDGWWKASNSMKEFIKTLYPTNTNKPWWENILPMEGDFSKCVATFILQNLSPNNKEIVPINIGNNKKMKITTLIKRDNRRKINTHDWMLSSFAGAYNSEYVFLTDCGTLFEKKCLVLLVKEMNNRKDCTAVSGRQRVMTPKQQGSKEKIISLESIYRAAQCYDYESSLASFVGAFSLFGMLPVIPGPCGLYRYSAIKGEAIEFYINNVALHPAECGIMLSNLNLAEDRVLSYSAVVKTHEKAYTSYVPEALFYFAAETSPVQLFQQRRRWINGTMAGYLWLLLNPSIIINSKMSWYNKPFIILLLMCQMFMYLAVGISPAIFSVSFYWSLQWAQEHFNIINYLTSFNEIILTLYMILYIIFVFKHSSKELKPPVSVFLVHLLTFLNAFFMIFIMCSLVLGFKDKYNKNELTNATSVDGLVGIMVLISLFGPLCLALIHSLTSVGYMLLCIIPFYLFLPSMVTLIGVYAVTRTWDLTWGNRPSEKSSQATVLTEDEIVQNQIRIKTKGMIIAFGTMIVNLLVIIVMLGTEKHRYIYLVILAFFIFTWSIIQMLFSLIYFIDRFIRKCRLFCKKKCNINCCIGN